LAVRPSHGRLRRAQQPSMPVIGFGRLAYGPDAQSMDQYTQAE